MNYSGCNNNIYKLHIKKSLSKRNIIIAVDGYSSCGKSTFAKRIAKELKYIYVDTGAMYRAIALFCLKNKIYNDKVLDKELLLEKLPDIKIWFNYKPESGISETFLNGENVESEIRKERVSQLVSKVSSIKEVRKKLVELQQIMGKSKGMVMDGRDIGSVVFPDAEIKIFMTADTLVRAQRRYEELLQKGDTVILEEVENHIIERDRFDISRKESPLVKAPDAIELDNTDMTVDDQMEWFRELYIEVINKKN